MLIPDFVIACCESRRSTLKTKPVTKRAASTRSATRSKPMAAKSSRAATNKTTIRLGAAPPNRVLIVQWPDKATADKNWTEMFRNGGIARATSMPTSAMSASKASNGNNQDSRGGLHVQPAFYCSSLGRPYLINLPARNSATAWRNSSCVFMTIGPYQATGSSIGLPETSRKRMP